MLSEIILLLLVLAVAAVIVVDVARTPSDSHHVHTDQQAHDTERAMIGVPRGTGAGESGREPARTAIPAAVHGAGPARRPQSISSSAGGRQPSRTGSAAGRELRNWGVSARLLLLVAIPAVAVAVVAFCVVRIVDAVAGTSIHSPLSSVRDGAIASAIAFGVAVIIVLALAAWFAIVTARSVVRPLGRLQAGALELPDAVLRISQSNGQGGPPDVKPIDVDSSDEIGTVARAFDQMRTETLRRAANEAALRGKLNAMLLNLSHRSQSLAERQIRLIESLEQTEQDTGRLASLGKMDRIAARMHRSAQNLLVLAGHDLSSSWTQPVALASVIGAAVSEVEDNERVSLSGQPDIAVRGPAINDVVHLLAELTENATSFSVADLPVDVSAQVLTTGGALIDITDRGIGMAAKEMAYANWQLENPSAADINFPKWMGLYVVARLAARHGIRVRLRPAEFGGLTALVWLPDDILTHKDAAVSPAHGGTGRAGPPAGVPEEAVDPRYATAERRATTARPGFASPEDGRVSPAGPPRADETGPPTVPAWSVAGPPPASQAEQGAAARPPARAGASAQPVPALGDQAATGIAGWTTGATPGPASSARSEGDMSPLFTASSGAGAPPRHEAAYAGRDVIVPPAEGPEDSRRLPIFDEVESRWFGAGRLTPGRAAAAGRWSSPADEGWRAAETVDAPASGGSTAAGLPRRLPNANLVPGAIPSTEASAVPNRSAAAARDRLAGFQRGVSEGRAAASEAANQGGDDQP